VVRENEPATSQSPFDPAGQVRGAIVLARLGTASAMTFLQERQLMKLGDHNVDYSRTAIASPVRAGAALGCGRTSQ
jgi:hypothetical protein